MFSRLGSWRCLNLCLFPVVKTLSEFTKAHITTFHILHFMFYVFVAVEHERLNWRFLCPFRPTGQVGLMWSCDRFEAFPGILDIRNKHRKKLIIFIINKKQ